MKSSGESVGGILNAGSCVGGTLTKGASYKLQDMLEVASLQYYL